MDGGHAVIVSERIADQGRPTMGVVTAAGTGEMIDAKGNPVLIGNQVAPASTDLNAPALVPT
jgi:hypothetical protein